MAAPPREAGDERTARTAGGDTLRAFFALALEGAPRQHAERERARLAALPGARVVRWVRPEALHMTLRFLGQIPSDALPELLARVATLTREVPVFELALGGVVTLPSPRRARVIALEAGPEASLQQLASAVEQGVVEAGFPPEARRFRPHVTLGRVRRGARLGREMLQAVTAPVTPGSEAQLVTEAQLFRSDPTPKGSLYTSIGRVRLQAADASDPESPRN